MRGDTAAEMVMGGGGEVTRVCNVGVSFLGSKGQRTTAEGWDFHHSFHSIILLNSQRAFLWSSVWRKRRDEYERYEIAYPICALCSLAATSGVSLGTLTLSLKYSKLFATSTLPET